MYEWIKVIHILSVISWMVGLLYLPRLMVYHHDSVVGGESSETFKVMERRLLKAIMAPAMLSSWIFGIWLMVLTSAWEDGWFICKFFLVIILSAFHMFCASWVREFSNDKRKRSTKFFRFANEFPTLIMILVVILVIVRPF